MMEFFNNPMIVTIVVQTVIILFSIILIYYFFNLYKISKSKNHLEASFDSIEDALVAIGSDYSILRANRAYSLLTGCKFSELIGKKCYSVLRGINHPCNDCKLIDTINNGTKQTIDRTSYNNNNINKMIAMVFYPLLGTVKPGAIEHIRDITELEKLKRKLEERNISLSDTNSNLILVQTEINNELALARQVQQNLLPQSTPEFKSVTIAHIYHPVRSVGGDLYDFIKFSDDMLGIFIGDVSGHGLSSAFVGTICKMSLYQHSKKTMSTTALVDKMNNDLMNNVKTVHYLTCFWSVFNRRECSLSYSRAGHPMPVIFKKNGETILLSGKGTFLGILDDAFIEQKKIYLEAGDRCFMFTDGIYEVADPDDPSGEFIGYRSFVEILRETSDLPISETLKFVKKKLKHYKYEDDYTLIAMEINNSSEQSTMFGFSRHQDITYLNVKNQTSAEIFVGHLVSVLEKELFDKNEIEFIQGKCDRLIQKVFCDFKDVADITIAYTVSDDYAIVSLISEQLDLFNPEIGLVCNEGCTSVSMRVNKR